jgi:hypothetical protein
MPQIYPIHNRYVNMRSLISGCAAPQLAAIIGPTPPTTHTPNTPDPPPIKTLRSPTTNHSKTPPHPHQRAHRRVACWPRHQLVRVDRLGAGHEVTSKAPLETGRRSVVIDLEHPEGVAVSPRNSQWSRREKPPTGIERILHNWRTGRSGVLRQQNSVDSVGGGSASAQQAAPFAAHGVMAGGYDVVVATGIELISHVPHGLHLEATFSTAEPMDATLDYRPYCGGHVCNWSMPQRGAGVIGVSDPATIRAH